MAPETVETGRSCGPGAGVARGDAVALSVVAAAPVSVASGEAEGLTEGVSSATAVGVAAGVSEGEAVGVGAGLGVVPSGDGGSRSMLAHASK
jgi:hypothetical protein